MLSVNPRTLLAQTKTTVTGSIQDVTGITATSGTVRFTLRPSGTNLAYRVGGIGVVVPQTAICSINSSGQVVALVGGGARPGWGNTGLPPTSPGYEVPIWPNGRIFSNV